MYENDNKIFNEFRNDKMKKKRIHVPKFSNLCILCVIERYVHIKIASD
jgi:hypothetical protein